MMTVYIQRKKCAKKWNEKVPRMCLNTFFICSLRTVQIRAVPDILVIRISVSEVASGYVFCV